MEVLAIIAIIVGCASLYIGIKNVKIIKMLSITNSGPAGKNGKDGGLGVQGMTGPQGPVGPIDESLRTEAEEFVNGRLNEIITENIEERLNG